MSATLIVTDDGVETLLADLASIAFSTYLNDYPKKGEGKVNLINLCDTTHYLSKGYYCSLLAEARNHKILPTINTINALRDQKYNLLQIPESILTSLPKADLAKKHEKKLKILMGKSNDNDFQKLVTKLFALFPAPILEVTLKWEDNWSVEKIAQCSLAELNEQECKALFTEMSEFTAAVWQYPKAQKNLRWEMAILVDPEQPLPPSNTSAIQRFIKAASKVGIAARTITEKDFMRLPEFDALFIRETTAIDHYTYHFARKAELEGMVVIDDTTSILRCCNKIFLHDAFSYHDVPSLRTKIIWSAEEAQIDSIEQGFSYPMIIKMPESAFSKGVFKAKDRQQLSQLISELLQSTSLVLVQEYFYTDYDWRIGVLNGRCIYACKYFMASNHWQIYNHDSKTKRNFDGNVTTMPTFEVPRAILDAATKACKVIGNGLYGVDLKQDGEKAYVIEVNDNPSIDHSVEDIYLGDELYMTIMAEFARRLELRGR